MKPIPSSIIVGVAGGTGSGKTTLVRRLAPLVAPELAGVIELDSYYRCQAAVPKEERDRLNFDHPDSLDFVLLKDHLDAIAQGHAIDVPVYDFATHSRRRDLTMQLSPRPVIFVEGILALASNLLRERYTKMIFVDTPATLRFERRLARDISERGRTEESVRSQWATTVAPMHDEFCEPSRLHADTIVPETNFSDDDVRSLWIALFH